MLIVVNTKSNMHLKASTAVANRARRDWRSDNNRLLASSSQTSHSKQTYTLTNHSLDYFIPNS